MVEASEPKARSMVRWTDLLLRFGRSSSIHPGNKPLISMNNRVCVGGERYCYYMWRERYAIYLLVLLLYCFRFSPCVTQSVHRVVPWISIIISSSILNMNCRYSHLRVYKHISMWSSRVRIIPLPVSFPTWQPSVSLGPASETDAHRYFIGKESKV